MSLHQVTLSFNGGEVTPYLAHLNTFNKHASSAGRMENFLPMPFGGFRKRPGTVHVGYVTRGDGLTNPPSAASAPSLFKALAGYPRLETFNFSATQQFLMVFTKERLSIYQPDGTMVKSFPATGATTEEKELAKFSDPFSLQFAQVNDIVFIADPGRPPRRLSRMESDWELIDIPFTQAPLLDENENEALTIKTIFSDADYPNWVAGTVYAVGKRATYDTRKWVCVYAHTAASAKPPGHKDAFYIRSVPVSNIWGGTRYMEVKTPIWNEVVEEPVDTSAIVGQEIGLESNFSLFDGMLVGSVMRIAKERALDSYEVSLDAARNLTVKYSAPLVVQGGWNFITFGTWTGKFYLQVSRDRGKTWKDVRSYSSDGDRNINASGEEPDRVLMRVRSVGQSGATYTYDPRGVLSANSAHISGLARITQVTSATKATAVCLTPMEKIGTADVETPSFVAGQPGTHFWNMGAFSKIQGFPAAIGVHERRLVFGGTKLKPLSLWMSATDDLLNFQTGTEDDDGIHLTLASSQQDPIRWIASQRRLYIGTAGGEWVFGSENSDNPVSPTNLAAREHTSYGSAAALPALRINDGIFFVERQGRRLREFAYLIDRESYGAADLTRLAEHLTEGGITQLAWQANREPFLWAVTARGTLLSFAYHRGEEIAAWARHNTVDGKIRSVAVLRNETGDDDVYLLVERFAEYGTYKFTDANDPGIPHVDGTSTYLAIEKLSSGQQAMQEAGDLGGIHHVDGGISIRADAFGYPLTEVTLPRHLIGKQVSLVADGVYDTTYEPGETATVALDRPAYDVHAGMAITSTLTTLPQDIDVENGPTHSRLKRAHEMKLNVFNSFGGSYTYDGKTMHIDYTNTADHLDAAPLMRNGWISHTLEPAHIEDLTFSIVHDEPYPFLVRASILSWSLHEP